MLQAFAVQEISCSREMTTLQLNQNITLFYLKVDDEWSSLKGMYGNKLMTPKPVLCGCCSVHGLVSIWIHGIKYYVSSVHEFPNNALPNFSNHLCMNQWIKTDTVYLLVTQFSDRISLQFINWTSHQKALHTSEFLAKTGFLFCLSVVLWLDKGDFPKHLLLCVCVQINKRSSEPFCVRKKYIRRCQFSYR